MTVTITPQMTLEAPGDVTANANGMLTAAQQHILRRHLWRAQWSTILMNSFLFGFSLCVLALIAWLWWQIQPRLPAGRDPLTFSRDIRGIHLTFPGLRLIFGFFALWFAVLLWRSITALLACARVRREVRSGMIVSTVGAIIQHHGQTVALVDGRAMTAWEPRALEPVAPGHYRCWFLPRLGRLLSVQRLRDWERPTAEDEAVAARWGIAAMNGCDAASLPDNRAGMLTAVQAKDVARRERRERPSNLLIGAVFLAVGLWLAFSIWHLLWHGGMAAMRDAGITDLFWETAAAIVATAIGCYLIYRGLGGDGYRIDLKEGRVAVREGPVTKRQETGDDSNNVTYYYRVNGDDFAVSRAAYDALTAGLIYRLYFTPRSKHLVNIEWVEQDVGPGEDRPW